MTKNVVPASSLAKLGEGRHRVGERLYLQVTPSGVRSWIFRFKLDGVERQKGLGPLRNVSLGEAKRQARKLHIALAAGSDPLAAPEIALVEKPTAPTFEQAALAWYAGKHWRSAKHSDQVINSLRRYAFPVLGGMPVDVITRRDVLNTITPIWTEKGETASRVLTRIRSVMAWAIASEYRSAANPADWKTLKDALPDREKAAGHYAALSWSEMPAFFQELRARPAEAARALALLTLTTARSGEVLGATWGELDLDRKIWTVPGKRMKSGRPHRVPLAPEAVALLQNQHLFEPEASARIFPTLGVNAMSNELKKVRPDATVHGMRSAFRDWAAERTSHEREVCEAALAHIVGDKTERAYRRGDALEKRRALMHEWAHFLTSKAADVVPLSERRSPRGSGDRVHELAA